MLIDLLASCVKRVECNYPIFPFPSERVIILFDDWSETDPETREWANQLAKLCQVLDKGDEANEAND